MGRLARGDSSSVARNFLSRDNEGDLRLYTCAPLRGVVAAQMFFYPSRQDWPPARICSGIIFHYDDGGSRVVGEIRLENRAKLAGEMILKPKFFCLEDDLGLGDGTPTPNIHFVAESEIESGAHPDDDGYGFFERSCPRFPGSYTMAHPMRGLIHWWFTARQRNSIAIDYANPEGF